MGFLGFFFDSTKTSLICKKERKTKKKVQFPTLISISIPSKELKF